MTEDELTPLKNDNPTNWIDAYRDWLFVMEITSTNPAAQSGFAAGYSYGRERPINAVPADSVPMPTNENQAVLMALIGTKWVEEHAPHRLRNGHRKPPTSI